MMGPQTIILKATLTTDAGGDGTAAFANARASGRKEAHGLLVDCFIDKGTLANNAAITIADDVVTSRDLLNGQAADIGTADMQLVYNDIGGTAASGQLTATVASGGATKTGDVYLYIITPRTTN